MVSKPIGMARDTTITMKTKRKTGHKNRYTSEPNIALADKGFKGAMITRFMGREEKMEKVY